MVTLSYVFVCVVVIVVSLFAFRHYLFTYCRTFQRQRIAYTEIYDTEEVKVTILLPMHNEEKVAGQILEHLLRDPFEGMDVQIIAINDHSKDKTSEIINKFSKKHPKIEVLHRYGKTRGKGAGLNEALLRARGDVVIVFDADYCPGVGLVKELVMGFKDPEVGAVMGRVLPNNSHKNLLTQLLTLERSGGYQVDQQARYHLHLLPQYGGTVGGVRKDLLMELGGFDEYSLTEDTELSFQLYTRGWQVCYANSAMCSEEVPEKWSVRGTQIERWSRGHNRVMVDHFRAVFSSPFLNVKQKVDACFLLSVFALPFFMVLAFGATIFLFFTGAHHLSILPQLFLVMVAYWGVGNFAPFFQITQGLILDKDWGRLSYVPLLPISFFFSLYYSSRGFCSAVLDFLYGRKPVWVKTERFKV